ncbi:ATP-dependent Lhr-like helicase [Propionicimonas paludicola]|uniref:ATP-dependent Lhr-like helicase n=1 Tax=Propionicimonas paludicola TaxID=185243 RepID=A0A2A9CWL4_9ACTN|nr:DEAD/DEAH box helicase [Propionicimonas paludicola]PFG18062.1 ATP-dependent Lhr-like helicase [Propionicimonas paludicola]
MDARAIDRFSEATKAWFTGSYAAPTAAQAGAWTAISSGEHALVVAPTGSGKTLAAFLWALDRLSTGPAPEPTKRCRVLYISPLKALANDVERNLQRPLAGIAAAAAERGLPEPSVRVAVRSGDTPSAERRSFTRQPPDILITTPESLFLLLTSAARSALAGIETVIVDEIHAVAGTKRGAHLALSLERLDALLEHPAQRIGLSATVRPVAEVARFLAGGRPVRVVDPPLAKRWELSVVVPFPDLADLDRGTETATSASPELRSSTWPRIEERIVDEIAAHTSTLVFVNSRRLAERLTARLNELWLERTEAGTAPELLRGWGSHATAGRRAPAEVMAQSAISEGAPPVLARAHHGSVSREEREQIETDLKAGRLAAVVATSSLELGIDMGAIDLVIQVEAPPSVAAGLQRVGRAGHQVGAVSKGVLFPKFRGDLVQTAVAVERMLAGEIEQLRLPANPLDVLAQQLVAMVALDSWQVDDVEALVRRAAPFAGLTRTVLEAVLDMLAGRYPAEEFAELRPRLVWDRANDTLTGRRSAQRLAVISGGTIPDRGLYPVYLAGAEAGGRRVGELDEEMVYESRVGDVIALGTTSWRIESISQQQVEVSPAPGQAARLPFWKGDALGRPAELGRAVGGFVREISALGADQARARLAASGLDEWAIDNLLAYLDDQSAVTGALPHDRQLLIERFRDELGDWRVVVHSPFGAQVHAPWALIAAARLRERYGVDVQAMHADDGLLFRLPAGDQSEAPYDPHTQRWRQGRPHGAGSSAGIGAADLAELTELIFPEPEEVTSLVTAELGNSALFAARFRECAGRSLLLPRQRPGRRQALWQQRLRSSQLLQIASGYPEFPIVAEAVRECLHDVYDVPALIGLLGDVRARRVAVRSVETPAPSPFASSLLFGYVAQFLYENDSPLAERRAAALAVDPGLLADLLGSTEATALSELLDPDVLTRTEAELQQLVPERQARDADELSDLLRRLGPLRPDQLAARCVEPSWVPDALANLAAQARAFALPDQRWAAAEDAGRLRDGLGVRPPAGLPDALLAPVADPLGDLLARYARGHAPFTAGEAADWLGLGATVVREQLQRLVAAGRLVAGELRPPGWEPVDAAPATGDPGGHCYCDPEMLRLLRRRSLAALREAVEPVTGQAYARFLPGWQQVGQLRGTDGVLRVIEQLAGLPVPASALESLILPARVIDYAPAMLDELTTAGEVRWQGAGSLSGADGWVSLHPSAAAEFTLAEPTVVESPLAQRLLETLGSGGHFFADLVNRLDVPRDQLRDAIWELVWAGWLSNDSLTPLRALLGSSPRSGRQRTAPRARHRPSLSTAAISRQLAPPEVAGRWSVLPAGPSDPTRRTLARAEAVLDRYGVVSRAAVAGEDLPGGFAGLYRVLAAAEEAGRVRRGYFIEGLGAAQFGTAGAIDALRANAADDQVLVLAASDPANAFGATLPWPAPVVAGHQPTRKAGALVVLVGGRLVAYLSGRSLLSFRTDPDELAAAASALAEASGGPGVGRLTLTKLDGAAAIGATGPLPDALLAAGFALTPSGLRR